MKNSILFLFLLIISTFITSCNYDDKFESVDKSFDVNQQFTLPSGSKFLIDKAANTVRFELAPGYALMGETSEGYLSKMYDGGTLTCNCSSPSNAGCSPFVATGPKGEITGCSMNNCTSCTGKISASKDGVSQEMLLEKTQIIETETPVSFVTETSEYDKLRNPTSKIMNSEFAKKELKNFLRGFQTNNAELLQKITDIDQLENIGYILTPLNFYGYKIFVPIDKTLNLTATNMAVNEVIAKLYDGGGKYSCKCNTDEGGCVLTKQSVIIGGAVWCEAGSCGSCSMTTL